MRRLCVAAAALFAVTLLAACGGASSPRSVGRLVSNGHPQWRSTNARQPRQARAGLRVTALFAVPATPSGPPTPASGWKAAYADGFGLPLGVGADNTLKLDSRDQGCCSNGNEIAAERPEMVSVTPEGLKLTCEHREVAGKQFVCGGVSGYESDPSGYRTPKIEWKGQTIAFEWVGKLPPNYGTADPGVWMDGNPWTDVEFDFAEFWGYSSPCKNTTGWEGCNDGFVWFSPPHPGLCCQPIASDATTAFHRYTTYVWPTGSGRYRYSIYVDGHLTSMLIGPNWTSVTQSPEVTADTITKDILILTYALRQPTGPGKGFTSGSNSFIVRSIAVYIDGNHAANGQGVTNGGIAPGTTIGGSEPAPPPPVTTPTTTPTTTTTPAPPPPPPAAPATPTGCAVTSTHETTSTGVKATLHPSCGKVEGATGYTLWRTPPKKSSTAKAGEAWTSGSTPSFSNAINVEVGERYCFRMAASNSVGISAATSDFCVTA